MKKTLVLCVAMFLGVLSALTVFAEGSPPEKPAGQKNLARRFSGEVVSVDAAARIFTARNAKGEMTFDASMARIAAAVKLETLKPGDRIAVYYFVMDGKNVARAVGRPTERPRPETGQRPGSSGKPAPAPETGESRE